MVKPCERSGGFPIPTTLHVLRKIIVVVARNRCSSSLISRVLQLEIHDSKHVTSAVVLILVLTYVKQRLNVDQKWIYELKNKCMHPGVNRVWLRREPLLLTFRRRANYEIKVLMTLFQISTVQN